MPLQVLLFPNTWSFCEWKLKPAQKQAFVLDRACFKWFKVKRQNHFCIYFEGKSLEKSMSCVTDPSSTACLIPIIFSRALHQHTQLWIFIHKYYWEDCSPYPICGLHDQRWDGNILATYHIIYICFMYCSLPKVSLG